MSIGYTSRLIVIKTDLESQVPQIQKDASSELFDLWQEYLDNSNFGDELRQIFIDHPTLAQDFRNRLEKLSISENEKSTSLGKKLNLLYPTEAAQNVPDIEGFDAQSPGNHSVSSYIFTSSNKVYSQESPDFAIPRPVAKVILTLFGSAILIGGISIGNDFPIGIVASILLLITSIILLSINLLK